ncbi:MAG: Ada metal-binding domain-containing protein [Alphaproteobacteria bacterium]
MSDRMPDRETCDRARLARDARFDGRFFIAVRTTRIYCRPVCPVRPALAANITYFPTAAAAASAGYRPCLRCRPEAAPGSPAWRGSAASVARGMALIQRGYLDEHPVSDLAAALGIGARHLARLFMDHVGATPAALAATRRIHLAKTLIDQTSLPMTEIAFAAGFASLRRFNAVLRATYGRPPSALRRRHEAAAGLALRLAYRPPYDWRGVADALARDAIPGVARVDAAGWRRTIRIGPHAGRIAVRPLVGRPELLLTVALPDNGRLAEIVARVRVMFDLSLDPGALADHLRPLFPDAAAPEGLRLTGAWDGFEAAACALLARRLGAAAAMPALAGIAARLGERVLGDAGEPDTVFPAPRTVCDATLDGVPPAAAVALQRLASAVADGRIRFDPARPHAELAATLSEAGGLDPRDATRVAMRVLAEPDVDPRLLVADPGALPADPATLRPWGSYAATLLARPLALPEAA